MNRKKKCTRLALQRPSSSSTIVAAPSTPSRRPRGNWAGWRAWEEPGKEQGGMQRGTREEIQRILAGTMKVLSVPKKKMDIDDDAHLVLLAMAVKSWNGSQCFPRLSHSFSTLYPYIAKIMWKVGGEGGGHLWTLMMVRILGC